MANASLILSKQGPEGTGYLSTKLSLIVRNLWNPDETLGEQRKGNMACHNGELKRERRTEEVSKHNLNQLDFQS